MSFDANGADSYFAGTYVSFGANGTDSYFAGTYVSFGANDVDIDWNPDSI